MPRNSAPQGGQASESELTQSAAAYDRLRRAILSLELMPGEAVSERALEEFAGSSRTPVRAALARLEAEALVQRAGRGFAVAPIDLTEIVQAYAYRELLECEAVRQAARAATDAEIAQLRQLAAASAGAPSQPEPGAEMASAFHLEFARIHGNRFILRGLETALRIVYRARWLEMASDTKDAGAQQHAELVELVAMRRPEEAAAAMTAHLAHSRDRLVATLRAQRLPLRGRGLRIVA